MLNSPLELLKLSLYNFCIQNTTFGPEMSSEVMAQALKDLGARFPVGINLKDLNKVFLEDRLDNPQVVMVMATIWGDKLVKMENWVNNFFGITHLSDRGQKLLIFLTVYAAGGISWDVLQEKMRAVPKSYNFPLKFLNELILLKLSASKK